MIDRDDLTKSPVLTPGASLVPINANTGGFRGRGYPHPGNPGRRREQGLINSPSAYSQENWPNPPNEISDVDIDANWYSPFQPVTPFGPPYTTWPRSYDYPVGENLQYVSPRFQLFEVLRMVAQGWGLLQAVIQTRIDQLMRMPWTVRPKDRPDTENRRSKEVKEFLKGSPDGENNFETWMRMVLWDLLVIDAPTVYVHRRRDGKPYEWWCLDGATIKPLIDDAGRRPRYPNPAYQQIIKGLPLVNFSDHEILYARQRPRSNLPHFGYSPVEQILMEILEGLRKQLYKNSFWTEGSMPEMLMSVPETWRPEQIATFQSFFDGMLGGNTALKSKVRFIPNGMTPFSVKNANGEALHADEDEWLARIVCFALSVSPQPFIRQMNRATAESAQQEAQQEGLHPLMHWVQYTFIGPLIEDPRFGFGYDDVEFVFEQEKQVDEVKQMTKITGYVKAGIMTINEGRNEIDLNPNDAGDELIVESAQGPMPVKETLEANRAKAQAVPDQLAQQKAQGDLQLKAGKQQMGMGEAGEQRTQEAHDQQMAQGQNELDQSRWNFNEGGKQGVAKIGGSPFGKGRRREVSAPTPDAAQEALAASRISAALAREGKRVAAEYRAGALLKARKPIDIDLGDVADALGLEQAALDAAGGLRVSIDPDAKVTDVLNQRAVDFAADQAARLVVGIRKTTRDSLRELIADGIAEGKSRDEIADQIEADFSFSPERAERIASYELNTAFNGAALIGAKEAAAEGVNLKKRWLDAPGACQVCQENAADGLIDLDDDFSSGDDAPSAHPHCRCSLAFVVGDDDDDAEKIAKISAEEIDAEAARAVQPTEGQAEAGNYRMGHVRVHGLDVTIENARGSVRSKKGKGGKQWSVTMPAHYGYIKRTEGSDGDHVDVYLGPDPESERVFVVNQVNADTGAFDEHKCLLGFPDAGAARANYLDGFSDGRGADRLGSMTEMTIDRFKEWLDGDTTDPVAKRAKVSQSDAAYVDAAPGDRYCNDCSMFLPSSERLLSSCTAVNGAINPGGWCKFWEARGDVEDPAGRDAH